MKFFCVLSLLAIALFCGANGHPVIKFETCLIDYLKENEKLDQSFSPIKTYEDMFCPSSTVAFKKVLQDARLIENDKKICLTQEFNVTELVEYNIVRKLYELKYGKSQDHALVKAATEKVRGILEKAAETCHSDPTYGEAFNVELGRPITTAQKEENYCFTKYVIDNNLIDLGNITIDTNPDNISTEKIDCETMIAAEKLKLRKESFEAMDVDPKVHMIRPCLKSDYDTENAFDNQMATIVLDLLEIPYELHARNSKVIADKWAVKLKQCVFSNLFG